MISLKKQPWRDTEDHQASGTELLILIGLFALCIGALSQLYQGYENSQGQIRTERSAALGSNQTLEPSQAPEIGY